MPTTTHDFSGTHGFVSGAGGGIGHEIACQLIKAGAHVVAFDLKENPNNFPKGPGNITYIQGDIRDKAKLNQAFSSFEQTGLDFIVNAAGIILWDKDGSVVDMDLDIWELTMQVNLMAAIHTARLGVPIMRRAKKGAIVHIASVVALRSADNVLEHGPVDGYQVSKAAMLSMSKGLALTYGRDGIRSNTICPGAIWTPMTDSIYEDPERVAKMEKRTPTQTVGRPEDIANACLFLLSDNAAFITGADLVVDGGLSVKLG